MRISSTSNPAHPSPTAHNYTAGNNNPECLFLTDRSASHPQNRTASPSNFTAIGSLSIPDSISIPRPTLVNRWPLPMSCGSYNGRVQRDAHHHHSTFERMIRLNG